MKIRILDKSDKTVIKTVEISGWVHNEYRHEIILPRIGELIELPSFYENRLRKYSSMNARVADIVHSPNTGVSGDTWFDSETNYTIDLICTLEERYKSEKETDKTKYE